MEKENVKRVLWIDDIQGERNTAHDLFPDDETEQIGTIAEAIELFSQKDKLYTYDTIVLDIDFSENSKGLDDAIKMLQEKIYLPKDKINDKKFIKEYGGYFLFIYLLMQGYPSEQIAFLTGNPDMIKQLNNYINEENHPTPGDFVDIFERILNDCDGNYGEFYEKIDDSEEIPDSYKMPYKIQNLIEKLEKSKDVLERKKHIQEYVQEIEKNEDNNKDRIENTGDDMIHRFHKSYLEPPKFFAKDDTGILGRGKEEAGKWLGEKGRRTKDNVARWLILRAGSHIIKSGINMNNIVKGYDTTVDADYMNAFEQMYAVSDGLINAAYEKKRYLAVSGMLIPFDKEPLQSGKKSSIGEGTKKDICGKVLYKLDDDGNPLSDNITDDMDIRRVLARAAKQARNHCAHNNFGTDLSIEASLFLLMIAMTAVLDKPQRENLKMWYERVEELVDESYKSVWDDSYLDKIDNFYNGVRSELDFYKMHKMHIVSNVKISSTTDAQEYAPSVIMQIMGYVKKESRDRFKKEYYLFTIAVYIVKWLAGVPESDIVRNYGQEVSWINEISKKIVVDFLAKKTTV